MQSTFESYKSYPFSIYFAYYLLRKELLSIVGLDYSVYSN